MTFEERRLITKVNNLYEILGKRERERIETYGKSITLVEWDIDLKLIPGKGINALPKTNVTIHVLSNNTLTFYNIMYQGELNTIIHYDLDDNKRVTEKKLRHLVDNSKYTMYDTNLAYKGSWGKEIILLIYNGLERRRNDNNLIIGGYSLSDPYALISDTGILVRVKHLIRDNKPIFNLTKATGQVSKAQIYEYDSTIYDEMSNRYLLEITYRNNKPNLVVDITGILDGMNVIRFMRTITLSKDYFDITGVINNAK